MRYTYHGRVSIPWIPCGPNVNIIHPVGRFVIIKGPANAAMKPAHSAVDAGCAPGVVEASG